MTSDAPEFPYTVLRALLSEGRARSCRAIAVTYAHQSAVHRLRCNMSPKKCVFGCQGKTTLHRFPKNQALRDQWMEFVFPEHQHSCASVLVCSMHFEDDFFINKAQFEAGFANRLVLKDGAVPTLKVNGLALEPQAVSRTASNICVCLSAC
jgi:hypothetical protein